MAFSLLLELLAQPVEWQVTAFPNGLVSVKKIPDKKTLEAALAGRLSLCKMAFNLVRAEHCTMDKIRGLACGLQEPSRWDEQRSITRINISLREYGREFYIERYNAIDASKVYALKNALQSLSSAHGNKICDLRLHLSSETFNLLFSVMPDGGSSLTTLGLEIDSSAQYMSVHFWKLIPKFTALQDLRFCGKTVAHDEDLLETIFQYLPRLESLALLNKFEYDGVSIRSEVFANAFEKYVQVGHCTKLRSFTLVNRLAPMDCECLMRVMLASANIPALTFLAVGFYRDERVIALAADLRVKRPDLEVCVYK